MSLPNQETASAASTQPEWFAAPEATGQTPTPALRSWLTEPGLLTARLRSACTEGFGLEVLEHSAPADATPAKRRIFLRCGDKACVYAETLIPQSTIDAHPWLAVLGDEPLGERLGMEPGVARSAFRFCLLSGSTLPEELSAADGLHWARQSDFTLGGQSLTVTEIFLPAIESAAGSD